MATRREFLSLGGALAAARLAGPPLAAASLGGIIFPALAAPVHSEAGACAPLLDHALRPLMSAEPIRLCEHYANRVLLIVNTASKCGFTHQFEDLEALHRRYGDGGLSVLGFPSEDFRQELDSDAAVAEFCKLNYGVSFPMFQKVHVRGNDAHPLYAGLAAAAGGAPDWNFYKYLIDRDGRSVSLYRSTDEPLGSRMTGAIEQLI